MQQFMDDNSEHTVYWQNYSVLGIKPHVILCLVGTNEYEGNKTIIILCLVGTNEYEGNKTIMCFVGTNNYCVWLGRTNKGIKL